MSLAFAQLECKQRSIEITTVKNILVVIAVALSAMIVACSSSPDFDETPTAAPIANIDLRLTPPTVEVISSASFVLTIEVEPNGNDVVGIQVRLTFDTARLQVTSAVIDPESPLSFSLETFGDNELGEITIAAGLLTASPPTEAFTLGSVTFEVLPVETVTTTAVSFIAEGRRRTIASIDGDDITGKVTGSIITIQPTGP